MAMAAQPGNLSVRRVGSDDATGAASMPFSVVPESSNSAHDQDRCGPLPLWQNHPKRPYFESDGSEDEVPLVQSARDPLMPHEMLADDVAAPKKTRKAHKRRRRPPPRGPNAWARDALTIAGVTLEVQDPNDGSTRNYQDDHGRWHRVARAESTPRSPSGLQEPKPYVMDRDTTKSEPSSVISGTRSLGRARADSHTVTHGPPKPRLDYTKQSKLAGPRSQKLLFTADDVSETWSVRSRVSGKRTHHDASLGTHAPDQTQTVGATDVAELLGAATEAQTSDSPALDVVISERPTTATTATDAQETSSAAGSGDPQIRPGRQVERHDPSPSDLLHGTDGESDTKSPDLLVSSVLDSHNRDDQESTVASDAADSAIDPEEVESKFSRGKASTDLSDLSTSEEALDGVESASDQTANENGAMATDESEFEAADQAEEAIVPTDSESQHTVTKDELDHSSPLPRSADKEALFVRSDASDKRVHSFAEPSPAGTARLDEQTPGYAASSLTGTDGWGEQASEYAASTPAGTDVPDDVAGKAAKVSDEPASDAAATGSKSQDAPAAVQDTEPFEIAPAVRYYDVKWQLKAQVPRDGVQHRNRIEPFRRNKFNTPWHDLKQHKFVEYGGELFHTRQLVYIYLRDQPAQIAEICDIRELGDGQSLLAVFWCYSKTEAAKVCKTMKKWPAGATHMCSNWLEILLWDTIDGPVKKEEVKKVETDNYSLDVCGKWGKICSKNDQAVAWTYKDPPC